MKTLSLILAVLGSLWSGTASFAQAPPAVPALPDTERRTSYSLSASTCPACSVGFALYGDSTDYGSWIEVWLTTGSGTTTASTLLTAVTDYTLSSATGPLATIPRPITDATITLATARTGTLYIVGSRRPRRTAQFAENRGVAARDLNQALTDIIASNRETWDRTKDIAARSLQTAPGDTIGLLPAIAVRAGGILGFDSSGNPIALAAGSSGTANVVGPNVSVVGHIATFGNTLGTILLDGGLVGAGDFVGPGSSAVNHAVTFAGSTGKIGKDSGFTITPSTGTLTVTNAKTLTVDNSLEFAGTDSTVMTFPGASDTVVGLAATQTLTNKTLTSPVITGGAVNNTVIGGTTRAVGSFSGVGIGALWSAGAFPLEITGATTAFISQTNAGSTWLLGPTGSVSTAGWGLFSSTAGVFRIGVNDSGVVALGSSGMAGGVLTLQNSTGTGTVIPNGTFSYTLPGATDTLVGRATSDALTNKTVNGLTITSSTGTLTIAAAKTLTASNTLTFTGTDATSFAFPTTSDTVTGIAATQTLTNKTLTAPTINGGTHTGISSLGIRSTGTGAFDMVIANSENLTAQRALTLTLNDAARTINMSGNLTIAGAFATTGGAITLTATGGTNVTLPTTGTLATIDTTQTISGAKTFSTTQQFTDIKLSSGKIYPTSDGTTALQITKADATTRIVNVDTTNARIGINKTAGAFDLDVNGAANIGGALTFATSTITGLTVNNSPSASNDYLLYYSAADGAIRRCTVGSCAAAATAGVSSINGLTGALTVAVGTGISVGSVGTTVTLTNTGVTSLAGNAGAFTVSTGITNSANDIRLSVPVTIANGGTGDTGTAWTTYTPTVSAQTGSITSYTVTSARYKTIGKTVFFSVNVVITSAGSGSGHVLITLPVTAASFKQIMMGQETIGTGKSCFGAINGGGGSSTTVMAVGFYDNTYPGATSNDIVITGSYESA